MHGFDLRRNLTSAYDANGYATDMFAQAAINTIQQHNQEDPLFLYFSNLAPHAGNQGNFNPAPPEVIAKFAYIKNEQRRAYAAKVSILDEGIGKVIRSLHDTGMLANSVILFFSDNGAPVEGELFNFGSNYPYRGVNNIDLFSTFDILYIFLCSKRIVRGKVQFERLVEFGVHF